jgi:hypothetical protein
MKRLIRLAPLVLAAALCLGLVPRAAHAQYLGQFGPLNRMGPGQQSLGLYLGDGPVGLGPAAEFRLNYGDGSTIGFQAGLADRIFGLQTDLRAGLMGIHGDFPLELGGELAGGLFSGRGYTGIYGQLVPGLSWELDAGGGQSWAAWAGLGYRVTASTHRLGRGDAILRAGARFQFSRELGLAAGLEDLGGDSHLMVGAEYRFGGRGSSNVPGR